MFQLTIFTVSAGRLPGLHVDLQRGVLPARRLRHSHLGVQLPVQPRLLHARLPLQPAPNLLQEGALVAPQVSGEYLARWWLLRGFW